MAQSLEETRQSVQVPFPRGDTQGALHSSSNKLRQHVQTIFCLGSSLATQCPKVLGGLDTQAPSAYHLRKFLTPGSKAGVQHKKDYLHKIVVTVEATRQVPSASQGPC